MQLNRWPAVIGAVFSSVAFSAVNYLDWLKEARCADCRFPHGLPFAFYREDALYGGAGIVWLGMFGDILIGLSTAVLAALLFDWAWRRIQAQRT